MVLRVTMDFFQHRYYRLNKTLMTLIGQWPGQSARVRRGILAVFIFLSISQFVPQILALVKYRDDGRIVLDCVVPLVLEAICATVLIGLLWNSQKTLMLLNRIRANWQVWARDREVNVLHEYAEQGRNMTIVYTATIYLVTFVFMTQPILPTIIDVLLKNATEPVVFPYPVDYYHLDAEKYYCYIIMCSYVHVCMASMILTADDTRLITCAQHVCGIFAALGYKIERIGTKEKSVGSGESPYGLDKRDTAYIASCIDRHNDAIEYSNLIEATYTWTFFFRLGLGMIMINGLGVQVLVRTNDPEETIRFILVGLVVIWHFYIECYISQILMDHSANIDFYIYNSQWWRLSPKARKLVQLMMMHCTVPCRLTAGKWFVMSMRTFAMTLKTGVSYFTLVRSMQGL